MLFQMQKTRLKSDARHRIGEHLIDAAAEVGLETVGLLAVVVVLTDVVMNEKERTQTTKRKNSGQKSACAHSEWQKAVRLRVSVGLGNSELAKMETEWQIT